MTAAINSESQKSASPESLLQFRRVLSSLLDRQELSREQIHVVMRALMTGECPEAIAAAFLLGLRMKGETARELASAAEILREHMVCLETAKQGILDTCGTGGDGLHTFNISTATALLTAAAGVPVVKHGNRSVSSKSGSADVLKELGVHIECGVAATRRCLEEVGLAFCFAPHFHPAMRHVGALRKSLGVSTLFNCLGPLANPARAPFQLLGVGRFDLLDLMAGALCYLGTENALVVHSEDGLDEVSLSAPTHVRQVCRGEIRAWIWTAQDFGLEPCSLDDLRVSDVRESAQIIRRILAGEEKGAAQRIVLANTAAALLATSHAANVAEGVEKARQAIRSGEALNLLEKLVRITHE